MLTPILPLRSELFGCVKLDAGIGAIAVQGRKTFLQVLKPEPAQK